MQARPDRAREIVSRLKSWYRLIADAVNLWLERDAFQHAGALAFFMLFSLAPLVIILVSIVGVVYGEEAASGEISEGISSLLGDQAAAAHHIVDQLDGPGAVRGERDRRQRKDDRLAERQHRERVGNGHLGRAGPEGHLAITGRVKDIIIRNMENISAKEVEDLLFTHPDVADVAVIGVPDPKTGERVCAVVVPQDPSAPPDLASVVAHAREQGLMTQKLPGRVEVVDALPRNPTGKVLKFALKDRFSG